MNNCGRHKTNQNLKFCKQTEKMIELAGFAPKGVIVSYKVFKTNARVDGKLVPLACVNDDCEVAWLTEDLVNQDVRDAMNAFVADLEQGQLKQKPAHGR